MLGELAELALAMARDLAVRARASEDDADAVALATAFQKTSRVVRLTLALDFKLQRTAAQEARDRAREAAEVAAAEKAAAVPVYTARPVSAVDARKSRIGNLLNRLLWTESEGDEEDFEVLTEDLTARLNEAARDPDFERLPIEVVARRLARDMGLSGELTLSLHEPAAPEGDAVASPPPPPLADSG
ncbi:MAG TPA: hypothetical protein VHW05_16070 [Phenylobacterium sp.]|nr:hypothetical protein [Phenylobacterium sp.]